MIWKPHVTVAALARREDRFLLVEERIDGRIRFNQPAGHLEDGESLLQAVVRECREETAWLFRPRGLLGVYRWRNPVNGSTFVRFTFVGDCTDHRPEQPLDAGILATHWLTAGEIRERGDRLRSPLVLRAVQDALDGRCYPLELLTDVES